MHVFDRVAPVGDTRVTDRTKAPGAAAAGGASFADVLSDGTGAAEAPSPAELAARREAEEIARMQSELAAYRRERDAVVQGRTMDPPAYQVALPVNAQGYMPYVTVDQQKLIDRITDRYLGRPEHEMDEMWEELKANNVAPDQLARTARYFINLDGEVVNRAVATTPPRPAPAQAGTAWTASSV